MTTQVVMPTGNHWLVVKFSSDWRELSYWNTYRACESSSNGSRFQTRNFKEYFSLIFRPFSWRLEGWQRSTQKKWNTHNRVWYIKSNGKHYPFTRTMHRHRKWYRKTKDSMSWPIGQDTISKFLHSTYLVERKAASGWKIGGSTECHRIGCQSYIVGCSRMSHPGWLVIEQFY